MEATMKKTMVNLVLGLILVSSTAFAGESNAFIDALISKNYATLTDNVSSIVQMSGQGAINTKQAVVLVEMQLNALKGISQTDESLHGKRARLKSASIDCYREGIVAKLEDGTATPMDVLDDVEDALDAGSFPACERNGNGSERGK
jgi:hypothetical protein